MDTNKKASRFNFSKPEYGYLGDFNQDENACKGYVCEPLDLGLNPDEMQYYKANNEDNDEDDSRSESGLSHSVFFED